MDWIKVTPETMPPDMEPVAVKEYAFPWESEDDERAYVTCYNVLYNREMGVWLVKDPSADGKYIERNGENIKMWALIEPGYIVFEGSGTCPINDGAYERWFPTYEEAIEVAIESVKKDAQEFRREKGWHADVIVYKAAESLIHETHSVPSGTVVFRWKNF